MSLSTTAAAGDRLATLRSLRGVLAVQIETCESARDMGALSRQLTLVLAEIDELTPAKPKEKTPLDDLRDRRAAAARGAGASRPARSSSGRK